MKYFTIEELTRSATADRYGIDNIPTPEIKRNIERLIAELLDPAREKLGKPIYVNSGYRCRELNRKVGGVPNSFHLQGRAADLDTRGDNLRLFKILSKLPHVELIWENGGQWIHAAL